MVAAGESVPSPESRSEQPVVARKRPNGDRREAHGESGRTVCGQEVEAEFQSQWPWAVQCAGDVDSCRECGVPKRHKNCLVPQTRLVGSAVRNEGAPSWRADTEHVVDAEAQTVCLVARGWNRLESILRVFR